MRTRLANQQDLYSVVQLFTNVCAHMEGTPSDIEWRIESYPTPEILASRIAAHELILVEECDSASTHSGLHTQSTADKSSASANITPQPALLGACVITAEHEPSYEVANWEIEGPAAKVGYVHLVAVDPCQRGRGLAKVLLTAAQREAERREWMSLRLDVWTNNPAAHRLYQDFGFVDRGAFTLEYEDGLTHDAYLMELALGQLHLKECRRTFKK